MFAWVAAAALALAGAAGAQAAGPLVVMGIDAEDCGPGGHGPISVYQDVVNNGIVANVTNGGSGFIAFGSKGSGPTAFWNAIDTTTPGTVTHVTGAANIAAASFAGKAFLAIGSSAFETCSGLDQAESDALAARQTDIANFVNGGGGLLVFTQNGLAGKYGFLPFGSQFTFASDFFSDITPTAAGTAVGITNALDVCCWHERILTFPSFLSVLAVKAGTNDAVAVGGAQVTIPTNITLSPATATNPAGTAHTVTATVKDSNNVPQANVLVSFSVTAGPNTGQASAPAECTPAGCTTDANGQVSWTYTSNGQTGTDTITASFTDTGGTVRSTTASKEWVNNPPNCSNVAPNVTTLWPPNHKFHEITLAGATDPDGDPVTITITGVTQDEPINGLGDGDTSPDAQTGTASNKVFVRAERSGTGDGRVYRIAYTASDPAGATCTGSVTVGVPHDQGQGSTPVDSGQTVNSFGP